MIEVETGCTHQADDVLVGLSVMEFEGKFVGMAAIIQDGAIHSELVSSILYDTAEEAVEDVYNRVEVFADCFRQLVAYIDKDGKLVEDKCFDLKFED